MDITQAERQVLRALWAHPGSRSTEIISLLEEDFDWKAATIKTLLNRLKEKKAIEMRKEADGKFHYYPILSEQEQMQADGRLALANICSTKRGTFISDLIQTTSLSQADIRSLRAILADKLKDAPERIPCDCKPGQCNCSHGCGQGHS